MKEDHLSDVEKKLFDGLKREASPPASLEKKIVDQLIKEGHIKKQFIMKTQLKWAASIAAAFLLFLGGMLFERSNSDGQIAIEPTKGYMLLLHEGPGFEPGEPMEMFNEYRDWMINTFEKGVKITGQELKNEASFVKMGSPIAYAGEEAVEKTTGYFLLEANSLEEALEIAQANPHVKYGGTVEVKPFMVRQ